MIKRRILCHIMVVVTVLLSSGCAGTMQMYAGERRAKDEVAFIKTESGSGSGHLLGPWSTHILAVDGQEIGGHSSVEVLPGEHVVKAALSFMFNLEQQSFEDPKPLTFLAKAGHVYEVKSEGAVTNSTKLAIRFWIQDKTTGTVAAGTKPPEK